MLLEEAASCYPVIRIGEAEILQQKKYGELEYLCFPQLAKTGIADQIKAGGENVVPSELVKVIGDKILLKIDDDI